MSKCCPEPIKKQDPCWDGYVQRGMKPGQGGKMVPNCVPAEKNDTPMSVATNPVVTNPTPANPSSHINPAVGMKRPQYLSVNQGRPTGAGIHDKPGVQIWQGSFLGKFDGTNQSIGSYNPPNPKPDAEIKEYDGCGCETCMELNVSCENCPVCGPESDSELGMAAYDATIGKADEQQQEPASEQEPKQESFFNFRDMRPTRNNVKLGE